MEEIRFRRLLAARGADLYERLSSPLFKPVETPESSASGVRRYQNWQSNFKTPDAFHNRSAILDVENIHPGLKDLEFNGTDEDLPEWTKTAFDLATCLRDDQKSGPEHHDVPFLDLFYPLKTELYKVFSRNPSIAKIKDIALKDVAHEVIEHLAQIFSRCLQLEFTTFRKKSHVAFNSSSKTGYGNFLSNLRNGDIYTFFIKYAALTRKFSTWYTQYLANVRLFLERLDKDLADIRSDFNLPDSNIQVDKIGIDLSDRHNGGKTVIRVTFGETVVYYKPRPVSLERLIQDINDDFSHLIKFPKTIEKNGYGWSLQLPATKCDPERYYFEAGKLLAFSYIFALTDLHDGNITITSAGPGVLDGETFASPIPAENPTTSKYAGNGGEYHSVLWSGLLPHKVSYDGDNEISICGLTGARTYDSGFSKQEWLDVNTDGMALKKTPLNVSGPEYNSVNRYLNGEEPHAYRDEIISGFTSAYQNIEGLSRNTPFRKWLNQRMKRCCTRFLVRDTFSYEFFSLKSQHPRYACQTADADLEHETLFSSFCSKDDYNEYKAVIEHEIHAWQNYDVPYFEVPCDERTWKNYRGEKVRLFARSGCEVVNHQLDGMGTNDCQYQCNLIRQSLYLSKFDHSGPLSVNKGKPGHSRCSSEELITEAIAIGDYLKDSGIRNGEDISWMGLEASSTRGNYKLRSLSDNLYDGKSGIALFLAGLYKVTGTEGYKHLAEDVLNQFLSRQNGSGDDQENGAAVGLPSRIYTIYSCAKLLGNDSLSEAATALTDQLNIPEKVEIKDLDLICGGIGGLSIVRRCGMSVNGADDYLQSTLTYLEDNWGKGSLFENGFAHGISGLFHALKKWGNGQISDHLNRRYEQYLVSKWSEKEKNWLAMPQYPFLDNWAHGGIGIAMSIDDAETGSAVSNQLLRYEERLEHTWFHYDNLSNGNCGIADFWIERDQIDRALEVGKLIVSAKRKAGHYQLPGQVNNGLFSGLAGIGYTLLRIIDPNNLPTVLTFETT